MLALSVILSSGKVRSCLNFISELFERYFEYIFFVVLQGIAGYFQKTRKKRCRNRLKEAEMNIANIELFSNKIQIASYFNLRRL